MVSLIALFTDFGLQGPYVGQMQAVLAVQASGVPVIDLLSRAPAFRPRQSAYLLAGLTRTMPGNSLFLAVVDPGVGGERQGLILKTDRHWFVGPDNGLLAIAARQARKADFRYIGWIPEDLSASFHGRDWFAPVAARIARGDPVDTKPAVPDEVVGWDWPQDLAELIYIDEYGNGFTGVRARGVDRRSVLWVGGQRIGFARTFSAVPQGAAFWYENSCGLVEIAVNSGNAQVEIGLEVGTPVRLELNA